MARHLQRLLYLYDAAWIDDEGRYVDVNAHVRSHAGVLADGVTPFNNDLEFAGTGYQALTVNLKYHF